MPAITVLILLAALLGTAPAVAQVPPESDPHEAEKSRNVRIAPQEAWREGRVVLPAYPEEGSLVAFRGAPRRFGVEHFIDVASLSLGEDGVSRYTAVVVSRKGAWNVFFEGIHCANRQIRTYARGDGRGGFDEIADSGWRDFRNETGAYAYRRVLFEHVLCNQYNIARSPRDVERRLRYPRKADDVLEY